MPAEVPAPGEQPEAATAEGLRTVVIAFAANLLIAIAKSVAAVVVLALISPADPDDEALRPRGC